MRPYLAIVRDSFHEAFASRTLWFLLVAITLLLAALAPLGYQETMTTGLNDLPDEAWQQLLTRMQEKGPPEEVSFEHTLWQKLPEKTQQRVVEFELPKNDGDISALMEYAKTLQTFVKDVVNIAENEDLYTEADWADKAIISSETRKLINSDVALSELQVKRRNRLLLEAAFPDLIETSPPISIQFRYLWYEIPQTQIPGDIETFRELATSQIVTGMNWIVGGVVLLVAILVTSPIVPNIFDPGSLNLLLSKPISRSLLFLSKFLGGCAFVLLNASYMILGLWLILAVRFGMWDPKLLLSIPIFVVMFAIYYSVSALSAIVWRNAVVAISVTIMFWALCLGLWSTKAFLWEGILLSEGPLLRDQIAHIVPVGDDLFTVNAIGLARRWDEQEKTWIDAFISKAQRDAAPVYQIVKIKDLPKQHGPIYDAERKQIVSIHQSITQMGLGGMKVYVGDAAGEWKCEGGADAPPGVLGFFQEPDGKFIAVNSIDIYRLVGNPRRQNKPLKMFGISVPMTGGSTFRSVGPPQRVTLTRPAAAALHPGTGKLALFTQQNITLLAKDEAGVFQRQAEQEIKLKQGDFAMLSYAGDSLVVASEDGRVLLLDANTLELKQEFAAREDVPPQAVASSPDGQQTMILSKNGKLWLIEHASQQMTPAPVKRQTKITACSFAPDGNWLVADEGKRVVLYDADSHTSKKVYAPTLSIVERGYRYAIKPLYTLFPKPGEMDKTIQYLMTGKKTLAGKTFDPWLPIWTSLVFMVVLLLIACVYIERQEF